MKFYKGKFKLDKIVDVKKKGSWSYSELRHTSKMELFAKVVHGLQL